jgi:hypothetical protein
MEFQLGDYLTAINSSKKNIIRDADDPVEAAKKYPAYIINRLLSYHADAVLIINALNKLPQLDNQLQFEFLLHGLPKKKRFSKLHKVVTPENVDLMKKYYKYSTNKAIEVLDLHTPEQIDAIRAQLSEGGTATKKKK